MNCMDCGGSECCAGMRLHEEALDKLSEAKDRIDQLERALVKVKDWLESLRLADPLDAIEFVEDALQK